MLLLLKKGESPKVLCSECNRLHPPKQADLAMQAKQPIPMFLCGVCERKIRAQFDWLNAPKRWAKEQARSRLA